MNIENIILTSKTPSSSVIHVFKRQECKVLSFSQKTTQRFFPQFIHSMVSLLVVCRNCPLFSQWQKTENFQVKLNYLQKSDGKRIIIIINFWKFSAFGFKNAIKFVPPVFLPGFAGADQYLTTFFNIIIKICIRPKKIRLIESNSKCRHPKNLTCKGTLRQVFICLRPRTQYRSLHIRAYNILIHTGKGGELNQREGQRSNSSQSWVVNTNMTASISTLINTWQKVPLQVNFYR